MSGTMDILQALTAQPNEQGSNACVIQRWLDKIDDDTPGKDDLVATITATRDKSSEHYRTRQAVALILSRLGFNTTVDAIGDHRSGRCRCFY